MKSKPLLPLLVLGLWAYSIIFLLPYAVWEFALAQNWFLDNGLLLFKDVIYHHTQLPLFYLYGMSKLMGNTYTMMRTGSFVLLLLFGFGLYLTAKQIGKSTAVRVLILLGITFPVLFNNFNIEEITASLCGVYSLYFFLKFWPKKTYVHLLIAGIMTALGIMSKQVMVGLVPAYILASAYYLRNSKAKVKILAKGAAWYVYGALVGTAPFIAYYMMTRSLSQFFYWNFTYNLFVYPKIYSSQISQATTGQGGLYCAWLLLSLVPAVFLFFRKNTTMAEKNIIFLLTLLTLCMIQSLLPSFHVYKILPLYPYPLLLWAMVMKHYKHTAVKLACIAGFAAFLIPAKAFYIDYLPVNFGDASYITSFGDQEQSVAHWLTQNTQEKEKVMNMGSDYITTYTKRLPANRFVYVFPWLVWPFNQSSEEILGNPPTVVIVDNATLADFPSLLTWPFLAHVQTSYDKQVSFGTYDIYTLPQ